ncbi:MAG: GxxExxY protein [Chloroflexi bacterium]|nr:GxxExxY protein [Chloroflexota bacterium]
MDHAPLSEREEQIAQAIVAAAFAVHSALGPGLLEHIYEVCFCHELTKRGLSFVRQVVVPIVYDGVTFEEGLRLDVLVESLVICELKAIESMNPVFQAQLLTQMKLTGKRLGFLINFNVPLIKNGVKRVIL